MMPFPAALLMRGSAPSGPAVPQGALVYETLPDSSDPRNFDAEAYDDASWWDFSVDGGRRLTVPSGVSLVSVAGQMTTSGSAVPSCILLKNGGEIARHAAQENWCGAVSGPMAVSPGDYFTMRPGSGTPDTTGGIWMGIETLAAATKYARVSKTTTQTLVAATNTAVTWDNEVADTDGWHDNISNNSRLTVPSGVSRVRVSFGLYSTAFVDTPYFAYIAKNGSPVPGGAVVGNGFGGRMCAASAVLEVSPGDYFEVIARSNAGQTISNNAAVWFCIEEVPDYARCLVKKASTQAVTSGVTTAVAFGTGSEVYDTANIHDESTNNSRLTVPSGYTRAKLNFSLVTASAAGLPRAWVRKNGTGTVPLIGLPGMDLNISGVEYLSGTGAWVAVSPGDYFELMFTPGANQTLPVEDRTYFAIELA